MFYQNRGANKFSRLRQRRTVNKDIFESIVIRNLNLQVGFTVPSYQREASKRNHRRDKNRWISDLIKLLFFQANRSLSRDIFLQKAQIDVTRRSFSLSIGVWAKMTKQNFRDKRYQLQIDFRMSTLINGLSWRRVAAFSLSDTRSLISPAKVFKWSRINRRLKYPRGCNSFESFKVLQSSIRLTRYQLRDVTKHHLIKQSLKIEAFRLSLDLPNTGIQSRTSERN